MIRFSTLVFVGLFVGATLLIGSFPRLNPLPLHRRLRPYIPGRRAPEVTAFGGMRALLAPPAQRWGDALARAVGVDTNVGDRLRRLHRDDSAAAFRVRQLLWALAVMTGVAVLATVLRIPPVAAFAAVVAAPVLTFLVIEQHLARADEQRREQVLHELPVVAEQLAMHLGAGYSLSSAVARLGRRSNGACAEDLRAAARRIRGGTSEISALREWAELSGVDAVSRLVGVLALNQEAGDLGGLIAAEARGIRREVHRRLIETIERREQLVWVPVTVATLVPGVIFLIVPFIHALSRFTG